MRAHLDAFGGYERAPVESGIPANANQRPGLGRDQAVDLGVGPGIDISIQHDIARPRDVKTPISKEARSETDPPARHAIGEGGTPPEEAGGPPLPAHLLRGLAVVIGILRSNFRHQRVPHRIQQRLGRQHATEAVALEDSYPAGVVQQHFRKRLAQRLLRCHS